MLKKILAQAICKNSRAMAKQIVDSSMANRYNFAGEFYIAPAS